MERSFTDLYNQKEESIKPDLTQTVEKTMKKYADNILRFVEGISGRLSQLELDCYNLEQSVGELRSDSVRDHREADLKFRSLEKHLQEVHRSVQILRDKQELFDTQNELVKLQLVEKESITTSHSHHNEEGVASSASNPKKYDSATNAQNQQLALALPHQITIPTSVPARAAEQQQFMYKELIIQQPVPPSLPAQQTIHVQSHPNIYYSPQKQLPSKPPQNQQHCQDQSMQVTLQYLHRRPQLQDVSRQAPQSQPNVSQSQKHPLPLYQQQWLQQSPQQFPQQLHSQQQSLQAQIRPQTQEVYATCPPHHHVNPLPETLQGSMLMQVPFSGVCQSFVNQPEAVNYSYGKPARASHQQPTDPNTERQLQPQTSQKMYGAHLHDSVYPGALPHPPQSTIHGYGMYDTDSNRHSHPQHFQ